ncbi:MAG: histidine kinase dimerization/phospho-acceptor domain-containing protein [Thiotrichales bacterium]
MFSSGGKLNRKLTILLYGVLSITSFLFLALVITAYQVQLQSERSKASSQLNLLLSATLENAMLKRDLSGLQAVIDRLGQQPEVHSVSIINPQGEIRFSSIPATLGEDISLPLSSLCDGCDDDFRDAKITTRFLENAEGVRVLRSVNPVRNREACSECHGVPSKHPVNGLLIVDYDATPIFHKARLGLAGLLLAGFIVMLLVLLSVWWFIRKHVIQPVNLLDETCAELAQGNLSARSAMTGSDEFQRLSDSFNKMAERLDISLTQLLEKESYLQSMIEAFPDGIRVIDEDFRTVNSNLAFRQLLNLSQPVSEGEPCYRTSYQTEKPCPPTLITCPVHEIKRTGLPIKTMHEYKTEKGNYTKVQVFAAPMEVEVNGKSRRFFVESIRDLMKDIHFSHEHKLSALGQLAAGVSHEIRNLLTSIRLALDSALKRLNATPGNDPAVVEYLALVDGQIDRCLDITGRLLKMSSLAGDDKQLIDVNTAISETLSLVQYEARVRKINLITQLDSASPRVLATETDLRMVI